MVNEIQDRVQKFEEEKIFSEIASGKILYRHCSAIDYFVDNVSRKRKFKSNEFLLLEKRKKPVTVTDILLHFTSSILAVGKLQR